MLAWFWRAVTAALALLALLWAVHWSQRGAPVVALLGALVILFVHVPAMAAEFFVLLPRLNKGDPAPPASFGQRVHAWWEESTGAVRVFGWLLPWRANAEGDHLDAPALRGQRALVLVHGFICNRALWNGWMRRLRAEDVPYIAVNLEPVFGSISKYADVIDDAVRRATAATGLSPLIVAHSMGGLAARAWLHAHQDGDSRIAGVVTIGTPHHGTSLARLGYAPNAREMRRAGPWLAELGAREPATRWTTFTCFYSHCDNIVLPASTATLAGARNIHVPGAAHVALVGREEVFAEVLRLQRQAVS